MTVAAWAFPLVVAAQSGFGGARDNGFVRRQANEGYVPQPGDFAVEGMLAEHHFPVRAENCNHEICINAAMGHGIHRTDHKRSAYLLIEPVSGFETQLAAGTFHRSPLNLSVVLDRSGSMSGWKFSSAIAALHELINRLGPNDRLSIVTFDHEATLVVSSRPVTNRSAFHEAVDRLEVRGSTDINAGLRMGYAQLRENIAAPGTTNRVFLLTDAQPNTGDTSPGSFSELVGEFASRHIGLSVVGVGLDLGAELAQQMSRLEGGSYHYLEDAAAMERVFGQEFDSIVTPVATRLSVTVNPGAGLRVAEVVGVPGDDVVANGDGSVTLRAATVFLDRRRTGVIVRMDPTGDNNVVEHARATLTWRYLRGSDGETQHGQSVVAHDAQVAGSLTEFETRDHYRAYALVNFANGLKRSLSEWYAGSRNEAIATLTATRTGMAQDLAVTEDTQLASERALADRLLTTMIANNTIQTDSRRSE
jgi:Ca-activated chloride channel homolog